MPIHNIELSLLPPKDRCAMLAAEYAPQISALTGLFGELLGDLGIPHRIHKWIKCAARLLLGRFHSREETDEIRGIATTANIEIYLLVSLIVILDLLMGCTSGAVRSLERGQSHNQARMLHFRTLDWGMDPLRSVVVQLDFVKSKSCATKGVSFQHHVRRFCGCFHWGAERPGHVTLFSRASQCIYSFRAASFSISSLTRSAWSETVNLESTAVLSAW